MLSNANSYEQALEKPIKKYKFLTFSKFRVYLLLKRNLKSSCQYKISFRMMFRRPSTAILLVARLKIFLFLIHTLTLKIDPFLPKFEFLPPGGISKAPTISLIFCTRHFFMHLDFEEKVKNDTPY